MYQAHNSRDSIKSMKQSAGPGHQQPKLFARPWRAGKAFGLGALLLAVGELCVFLAWFRLRYEIVSRRPSWQILPPVGRDLIQYEADFTGFGLDYWYGTNEPEVKNRAELASWAYYAVQDTEPPALFYRWAPPIPTKAEKEAARQQWRALRARIRTLTASDPELRERLARCKATEIDLAALGL